MQEKKFRKLQRKQESKLDIRVKEAQYDDPSRS